MSYRNRICPVSHLNKPYKLAHLLLSLIASGDIIAKTRHWRKRQSDSSLELQTGHLRTFNDSHVQLPPPICENMQLTFQGHRKETRSHEATSIKPGTWTGWLAQGLPSVERSEEKPCFRLCPFSLVIDTVWWKISPTREGMKRQFPWMSNVWAGHLPRRSNLPTFPFPIKCFL